MQRCAKRIAITAHGIIGQRPALPWFDVLAASQADHRQRAENEQTCLPDEHVNGSEAGETGPHGGSIKMRPCTRYRSFVRFHVIYFFNKDSISCSYCFFVSAPWKPL